MGMGTPMVVMLPLLLPAHQDGQMGAGDAAFDAPLQGKGHPRQAQAVEPVHKGPRFRQQLQQGRRQHVPLPRPCHSPDTVSSLLCLHVIDHTGQIPGPKSIVNVHHRNPTGAGIEHGQQGR